MQNGGSSIWNATSINLNECLLQYALSDKWWQYRRSHILINTRQLPKCYFYTLHEIYWHHDLWNIRPSKIMPLLRFRYYISKVQVKLNSSVLRRVYRDFYYHMYIEKLMQTGCNCSAIAMELRLLCIKPSICGTRNLLVVRTLLHIEARFWCWCIVHWILLPIS